MLYNILYWALKRRSEWGCWRNASSLSCPTQRRSVRGVREAPNGQNPHLVAVLVYHRLIVSLSSSSSSGYETRPPPPLDE